MRAVLSFFWSGLFGLGKFALLTTSLCVALIVAISGPPTASELAGLRTAAGDALGALDRISRAAAEDMCETMSADAREAFCGADEQTPAPVHATAPSTLIEAPPPPPRVQSAAARLEASLSPDNGQLLGGPGQASEPRARGPERAERRAEADPPRARSSQRAERRAAAEPRAQTRPSRRVAAARTPTQRTAPARARAEPARRPAERAPVVRAAAPTAPVIEAQRAPAVAEPPASEPILEPAVGRTPAGGADYGDDAYESAPSSRAARPARARWEDEEVEEPPLVEAKDEEWGGYEDEDYAEDPYDPDEVW